MPATSKPLLIALVHWNARDDTLACLRSLLGAADAGHQILVVDNGSVQEDGAAFRALHASIRYLRCADNQGYAAALNVARRQCLDGDYLGLFMLNSDTVVAADCVDAILHAARFEPSAILACLVLDAEGQYLAMPEKFLHADARWRFGHRDRRLAIAEVSTLPMRAIAAAHGAAWFVPRALLAAPFLDERFFLYCEETDFCLRMGNSGAQTFLVRTARVRHRGGGSGSQSQPVQRLLDYYRTRNEIELWRRHAGRWWYWVAVRKCGKALLAVLLFRIGAHYLVLGCWDALCGRLGKRFAPESVWSQP